MGHNNPIRRAIIGMVSTQLPVQDVAEDFGVSDQTVYNARNDDDNFALELQTRPNVQRERISDQQYEAARSFLDEVIPVVSGRNYRVQRCTNESLYAIYFCWCMDRHNPNLGRTHFFENVLGPENIHHVRDDSICEYCFDFDRLNAAEGELSREERDRLDKCDTHKKNWYEQYQFFVTLKKDILQRKEVDHLVVVHDFTQIKVQSTFYQDLIVVTYHYDNASPEALVCSYNHFLAGESSVKNDTNFVVRTWNHLIDSGFFHGYRKISVFSDGGPKHYKTTGNANYFGWVTKKLGVNLKYHFFETNHGHSACDAAASHAKKVICNTQRDTGKPINSPDEIIQALNKIVNTTGNVAPTVQEDELPFFNTFRGIRAMHKFEFTDTHVQAFPLSKDLNPTHNWALKMDYFEGL